MLVNTGIIIGENNNKNYRMEYCGLQNFRLYAHVLIIIMLQEVAHAAFVGCLVRDWP